MKQQLEEYGEMEKRQVGRMEGMLYKMLQSRPAVETGAKGEKTGERKEGAVVNEGHGILRSTEGMRAPLQVLEKSSWFRTTRSKAILLCSSPSPANRGFEKG